MSVNLTTRDVAILTDVWRFRYVTSRQVARLHFGHLKLAQRRLRILAERGVVDRFAVSDARQAGFNTYWYRLSRPGAKIVARKQDLDLRAILPPTRPPQTMGFLAHHTLLTDFRIWLREACKTSGFGYRFIPSYEEVREQGRRQRRVALSVPGHQRLLIPDGVFSLERGGRRALFALEVDRGTEPLTGKHPSAIERKLLMYRVAYDSRVAEERYGELLGAAFNGFRVLCLVPDEKRQQRFLELADRLDLVPLVWVARKDLVDEHGDLDDACWAVTPGGQLHRLTE